MTWAVQIRLARYGLGITQEALAVIIGVSWTTVSRWERGVSVPSQRRQRAILDAIERIGREER